MSDRFRTLAGSLAVAMVGVAMPALTGSAAASVPPPPIEWVVLGDSYTAGGVAAASSRPGALQGEEPHFADGRVGAGTRRGCDQTDMSWPNQVNKVLGAPGENTVALTANVSCAGALIEHVVAEPQTPQGQNVDGWSRPGHPYFPVDPDGDPGTLRFPRLRHVQLDAVQPSTKLVTVGIGAADVGLIQIFTTCMALGDRSGNKGAPCSRYFTRPPIGIENLRQRLDRTRDAYIDMLEQIRAKAHSDARIMAIGYPSVIPGRTDVTRCVWGRIAQDRPDVAAMHHFGSITHEDLDWLREAVINGLNTAINDAVPNDPHFAFLGLGKPDGAAHDVCADAGPNAQGAWIEGLIDQTPKDTGKRWPRPGFFHGNVGHHSGATETVLKKFRELISRIRVLERAA